MVRLVSFCCLLLSLAAIAVTTFNYVDPPVTDPLAYGFIKSDRYLPPGDSISRRDLHSPVRKLLEEDRRAYKRILCLAGFALFPAIVLFQFSSGPLGEPATPQENRCQLPK